MSKEAPCPACGAAALEHQRSSNWKRFRYWLKFGGPRRPSESIVCTACGYEQAVGLLTYPLRRRPIPVRLLDVLRSERSRIPTPLFYLEVAVASTLVGIVLDLTIGWPWWLFPLGGVAAAWLFFMSSAFWGGHRARSIEDSLL